VTAEPELDLGTGLHTWEIMCPHCGYVHRTVVPESQFYCRCGLRWTLHEDIYDVWGKEHFAG